MAEKSLRDYTDKQLFELEEKIRAASLGSDDESRRMLANFKTYVDAEWKRRRNTPNATVVRSN